MDPATLIELTDAQRRDYIEGGCSRCPDCGSHRLGEGDPQRLADSVVIVMSCDRCGAAWEDVFELRTKEPTCPS